MHLNRLILRLLSAMCLYANPAFIRDFTVIHGGEYNSARHGVVKYFETSWSSPTLSSILQKEEERHSKTHSIFHSGYSSQH